MEKKCACPLLKNPKLYNPDTIDLFNNKNERDYWLSCLDQMTKKFISRASTLNPEDSQATIKAERCYEKFHNLVEVLTCNPSSLKPLSVRTLLEFNEDNLRDINFKDAWSLQKNKETVVAFEQFTDRIQYIDSLLSFYTKWAELVKGVLAGNIFDWGSKAVADILETSDEFGFAQAMDTIQKRPWFRDDLDSFINKLETHHYKEVVIFVDNAGVDFVLGILPLTRELLKLNSRVILIANTLPALNDVTHRELKLYLTEAAKYCSTIKNALNDGSLLTHENGQKGPCLDLSSLPKGLCNMMSTADLIILEGMGRAVHTNLYAKFIVDSLKIAVLKNEQLARSLGASQFYVICDFQIANLVPEY